MLSKIPDGASQLDDDAEKDVFFIMDLAPPSEPSLQLTSVQCSSVDPGLQIVYCCDTLWSVTFLLPVM